MERPDEPEAAGLFETHRGMLRAVAYRMLGSLDEADDAVQEAWLRLHRTCAGDVDNLAGWLRTVVTRICLDMLRSRSSRREDLAEQHVLDELSDPGRWSPPEDEALLADSVSRALLVVLDTLSPAERIAFVLHDMFAVPFDRIAPMVERTPVATKKLASRARHKVRGTPLVPASELAGNRQVVSAFLAAARAGDLTAIRAVLAPDVVRRADPAAVPPGGTAEVRGARAVAEGTAALAGRSQFAELALVNGTVGAVLAPRGRLLLALTFTVVDDMITAYDVIADPARLRELDIAVLPQP
ncbi:sigma-70 family RNA polymerase sigma factor [Streptomyces sp. NBC_01306]|uniref:sigma-70 family RNA polymerase sigma factor n=1 Tax=Streptomyces sp. NBC_01306 TaxID=2903819 RepID=UPI00225263D8|nr:sigma-70 family RNA polymerase sigma factor [Streptomyces sp. NBC_01306]MCX4725654.1 sigma-70 family RNA polymerase sigma factor [Streptomyces sp. NBC_01306]